MINDELIKELFFPGKSQRFTRKFDELIKDKEIYNYLLNRFTDSKSIKESVYRIFYNIEIRPVCVICGKEVEFSAGKNINLNRLFKKCCCVEHENIYRNNQKILGFKNKLGTDNPWRLPEVKEKIKNTVTQHYGGYTLNSEILKEKYEKTCQERYGVKNGGGSTYAIEKIKNTCKERYGVDNPGQVEQFKEKIKNTTYLHYGVYCSLNAPEVKKLIKETMYNKYGTYFFSQSSYFLPKIIETSLAKYNTYFPIQSEEVRQKIAYTCLEKYGYTCYFSTQQMILLSHSPEAISKANETRKLNNTFNKSIQEETCYTLIKNKYSDVIRQYRSYEYPYACDFYIPSLDLYIEYNGSHYHHGHPFNENCEEDLKELERLKEKANNSERHKEGKMSQYDNVIKVWTLTDVIKRTIAKENNLNYIEFWNLDEVKNWINNK